MGLANLSLSACAQHAGSNGVAANSTANGARNLYVLSISKVSG